MVFASWSYDVSVIDLRERRGHPNGKAVAKKERGSDVFQENEEWTVELIAIERNEVRLQLGRAVRAPILKYGSLRGRP